MRQIDEANDYMEAAAESYAHVSADMKDTKRQAQMDKITHTVKHSPDKLKECVQTYPWWAMGVAVLAGLGLCTLLRRKK